MSELSSAIEKLVDSKIEKASRGGTQTVVATYQGRDGEGKPWVLLPGADSPTPVGRMAVEASAGDAVSVTIGDGMATVTANLTNPSAGVRRVEATEKMAADAIDYASQASAAASSAQSSAGSASAAAQRAQANAEAVNGLAAQAQSDAASAKTSADNAATAAATADSKAVAAGQAATIADGKAVAAGQAAEQANSYALAAGGRLSDVENIVGTLNWISEHGEYVNQAGEQFDPSKVYYTRSGTSPDYVYTVVPNPVAEDIADYYLLDVRESVQNYLASHLWMDDYGLNLSVNSASGYRIHQGTFDGTMPMGLYIVDPEDKIAAGYGSAITVGRTDETHMEASGDRLSFKTSDGSEVAYISVDPDTRESLFYMTRSVVVKDLVFGNWKWYGRANGNLALKWIGTV